MSLNLGDGLGMGRSPPVWGRGLKSIASPRDNLAPVVAPGVGAWVEMVPDGWYIDTHLVAPGVGAWVEINAPVEYRGKTMVAPGVGAWVETPGKECILQKYRVAPGVGAWVETGGGQRRSCGPWSPPVWGRGLK